MKVQLLVPDLFLPPAAAGELPRDALAPALETILARGGARCVPPLSLERWLASALLPGCGTEPPFAALSVLGEGIDPGGDWWLSVDPVHLEVHRDRVALANALCLELDELEAAGFIQSLNAHFARDEVEFHAPNARRWYLRTRREPRISTIPVAEISGPRLEPLLPQGADGAHWRRFMNEAQMLLHAHPGNEEREARQAPAINSIWPWGAGRLPAPARVESPPSIWSDHPLAVGIARHLGAVTGPVPEGAGAALDLWRAAGGDSTHLVVLDALRGALCGGLEQWNRALSELERRWFAPLWQGLRSGDFSSVTIDGLGHATGWTAAVSRRAAFHFWRARRPLHRYGA